MVTKQRLMVFWFFLMCGIPLANAQTAQQIATNLHVVEGSASGYAKLIGKKTKYEIVGISAVDQKRDLAILSVVGLGARVLSLGDSDTVLVGETVYAVGNPHGLEGTFSQGVVSGVRTVGTDKLIQLTASISPGSSGGPVMNDSGNVIGVSVATFRKGQNLNFAIPSNYLTALISNIRAPTPLSRTQQGKTGRSILSNYGGRSVEGVTAGKFKFPNTSGKVRFTLKNHLRKDVTSVEYLIIFYDELGDPIDTISIESYYTILAGLAKRDSFNVSWDVWSMCCYEIDDPISAGRLEFRILDFEIVE